MMILEYCNLQYNLTEDGILDATNRKVVGDVVHQILADIKNMMSITELDELNNAIFSHIPIAKQILELTYLQKKFINYKNCLYTRINTNFGFITFGIDLGKNINEYGASDVFKQVLIIKGLSTDGILRLKDILYLFFHYNTITHELIHFLDAQRMKKQIKTVQYNKGNEQAYYNSPKEFNAWSQEIFSYLEMYILDKITLPEKIDLEWVYTFLENVLNTFINTKTKQYKYFLSKLTKKNRNRFYNRLYDNFVKVWENEYNFLIDTQ